METTPPAGPLGGPSSSDGGGQDLSAAFLPYDDRRLWVGMPETGASGRKRRARGGTTRRSTKMAKPRRRVGARPIAAALLTLSLPVSAFVVTSALSKDAEIPTPVVQSSPTLLPSAVATSIENLQAEAVSSKRVVLSWSAASAEPVTYTVYRDGVAIGDTTDLRFADLEVEPAGSYYYSVSTVLSNGAVVSSAQMLVAVMSEPSPSSSPPPRVITAPAPSPSPSKAPSPSPSKSKIVWPSVDLGFAGSDPCAADPTQYGCPGYVPPAP